MTNRDAQEPIDRPGSDSGNGLRLRTALDEIAAGIPVVDRYEELRSTLRNREGEASSPGGLGEGTAVHGDPDPDGRTGRDRRHRVAVTLVGAAALILAGVTVAILSKGGGSPDRMVVEPASPASDWAPPRIPGVSERPGDEGHLLTVSIEPGWLAGSPRWLPELSVLLTNETGRDLEVRGCLPGGGTGRAIPTVGVGETTGDGTVGSVVDPTGEEDGTVPILAIDVDCDPTVRTWPAGRVEAMDLPLGPLDGELAAGRHRARVDLIELDGPILLDIVIE